MHSQTASCTPVALRRRGLTVAGVLLAAGLVLTGCTTPAGPGAGSEPRDPGGVVAIADTAVGEQLGWMLDLLNAEADITEDQLTGKFAKSFTEQAPLADVAEQLNAGVRPMRPFSVTAFEDIADDLGAARITGVTSESLSLEMRLDAAGAISEMLLRPAG